MAVDLSSLAPITTAATALSSLVLVSPQSVVGYQPQNPPNADGTPSTAKQPKALLFTYEGENSVTLESDITDHYVEDNTAVQDQIALRPETVTVRGYVGEVNNVPPAFLAPVKFAAEKLTVIGSYQPQLSATALLAYAEAFFAYQIASNLANSAVSAWETVGNLVTGSNGQAAIGSDGLTEGSMQNDQQIMFQQFYGYWRSRTLFSVQTPWAVFQNMAIKSLRAIQDDETNAITDFEVTFKMIRVASTKGIGNAISSILQGRQNAQAANQIDLGTSSPPASGSLSSGLSSMGVA